VPAADADPDDVLSFSLSAPDRLERPGRDDDRPATGPHPLAGAVEGVYPLRVSVSDGIDAVDGAFHARCCPTTSRRWSTLSLSHRVADVGQQVWIWVVATDNVGVTGRTLTIDGQPVPLDASGAVLWTVAGDFGPGPRAAGHRPRRRRERESAGDGQPAIRNPDNQAPQVTITSPSPGATVTELTGDRRLDRRPRRRSGGLYDHDQPAGFGGSRADGDGRRRAGPGAGQPGRYPPGLAGRHAAGQRDLPRRGPGDGPRGAGGGDSRIVEVQGNLKLGNFTLTFVDLDLPTSGIPITITRTYDTLQAHRQGDFGYGWRMDIDERPSRSDPAGHDSPEPRPFIDGDRIVFTLPDGSTHGFTFYGRPVNPNVPFADPQAYPAFQPDWGSNSRLQMSGRHPALLKLANGYDDVAAQRLYNPASGLYGDYELTLRSGVRLAIDPRTGELRQLVDRTGQPADVHLRRHPAQRRPPRPLRPRPGGPDHRDRPARRDAGRSGR
jgi:hypothetical protein